MPFAGSLGTLPLPDILNTLHNIHATGVLRLVSRVGSRDVVFQNGEITGVGHLDQERSENLARRLSLLSQGSAADGEQDEDARQEEALSQVFNLFAWNDADFAFSPAGPDTPEVQQLVTVSQIRPLNLNIQHVLMEAARQQDEWAALRARIQQESSGKGTAAIALPPPADDLSVDLGPEVVPPPPPAEALPEAEDDAGPDPVIVPAPRPEDREWSKPLISDEELAPTPWGGDSPTGQQSRPGTGHQPRPGTAGHQVRPGTGAVTATTSPPTTTVNGATVGPYRMSPGLELLNGSAYRGRHLQERTTEVAIKLAPAGLFRGEQGVNEALHQARLLAAVHHPALIPCLGVGHGAGGIYAAFAPRLGDDLAQLVERTGGALVEPAIIRIALDCAFALQALHHRALVHRDLRPDNMFVADDGRACVGPFALVDAPATDAAVPERGCLVAEPGPCTPPEVLNGVLDIDHRADIYALGCVIFFLATGQPPYHGATRAELARGMQGRPVPRIREINRHIGEGLDELVAAAMARERGQRVPSIDALIADLQVLDASHAPIGQMHTDEDSSASTYPAVSTGVLVAGPPMTRRHPTSSSTRIVTATMGTTGVARRSSTRITAVMASPSGSARHAAVVPQSQPITSLIPQPPPEPPPVPARAWGIYDLALVALVGVTVFWVVTTQSPVTGGAPSTPASGAPAPAEGVPRLPVHGHRLRFQKDPWGDCAVVGRVSLGVQGAVFSGQGLLRAERPLLSRALAAAGDFSLAVAFTAARTDQPGEGCLFAIAHSPVIANLVLLQMGSGLTARLRTAQSDASGLAVTTPKGLVTGTRQRLVLVRSGGRTSLYLDGVAVGWAAAPGDLASWDEALPLVMGADPQGRSAWAGTVHEVMAWPRALSQQEVGAIEADGTPAVRTD